jgi:ribosomal 30S subunit maturation factor RimM
MELVVGRVVKAHGITGELVVDVRTDDASMGHEATVSKVSEDQLFYLMSRSLSLMNQSMVRPARLMQLAQ